MTAINENNFHHTLKQLEFDILSGYFKPPQIEPQGEAP